VHQPKVVSQHTKRGDESGSIGFTASAAMAKLERTDCLRNFEHDPAAKAATPDHSYLRILNAKVCRRHLSYIAASNAPLGEP